ncbi:plasmid mobilization protein [Leuconostoc pseudomesenteroides]|uniref:plasmid mobilization protein n=1 Tax=Leuconostoc pseudomesenteroides TaxID=33968 RepID=UPI0039ED6DB0
MNQIRQIHYRLTELEYQKLANSASQYGVSPSKYAKKLALKSRLVKPTFSHENAVKLNLSLNHIGNNLNQLTRHANQTGDLPTLKALQSIQSEVHQLWQQLK